MKSLLIIGSRSFLGQQLIRSCASAGIMSIGYHRASHAASSNSPIAARVHADLEVDCDLHESVPAPAKAVDACVFAAQAPGARTGDAHSPNLFAVNSLGLYRTLCMLAANGKPPLLHCSTGTVYQPSFSALVETDPLRSDDAYALSKIHAESMTQLFAGTIACTNLRIFGLYGPQQRNRMIPNILSRVRTGQVVQLATGPAGGALDDGLRISLMHVEDAAAAIIALARRMTVGDAIPQTINLGSTDACSVRQIAHCAGTLVSRPPLFAATSARSGDLIADTSVLRSLIATPLRTFEVGLRASLRDDAELGST